VGEKTGLEPDLSKKKIDSPGRGGRKNPRVGAKHGEWMGSMRENRGPPKSAQSAASRPRTGGTVSGSKILRIELFQEKETSETRAWGGVDGWGQGGGEK